jgi:hypothetical protein
MGLDAPTLLLGGKRFVPACYGATQPQDKGLGGPAICSSDTSEICNAVGAGDCDPQDWPRALRSTRMGG